MWCMHVGGNGVEGGGKSRTMVALPTSPRTDRAYESTLVCFVAAPGEPWCWLVFWSSPSTFVPLRWQLQPKECNDYQDGTTLQKQCAGGIVRVTMVL